MYIELWCIITVSNILQRIKTVNKTSWYKGCKQLFSKYVFEQNIII